MNQYTSRRADIPEADTPPRKRLLLTTPRPGCEIGEGSAARQPGPIMAYGFDHSLVDTMETRIRDTERRMMTALEMVNRRVKYQVDVRSRESSEFHSRNHDAQTDRAAVRVRIESYSVRGLRCMLRWQRQVADDPSVQHILSTQTWRLVHAVDLLVGPLVAVLDFGYDCSYYAGVSTALAARDSTRNDTDSHSSGTGVRGSERVARECTYQDFMKCKPVFSRAPGIVVELTQWFEEWRCIPNKATLGGKQDQNFSSCTLFSRLIEEEDDLTSIVQRNEMKRLRLKVFVDLDKMFPEESDKIERYVGGLPDVIHGNIVASRPKTMQEAIEMATELMDKRVNTIAERQAENKRKFENNFHEQ
ncbi:hypothetical protein Tco_1344714 [Tanacetum coccineum]